MLRTMIVDDEPLAIERMQVLCAEIDELAVIGTASDGEAALRLADKLKPDLLTQYGAPRLDAALAELMVDSPEHFVPKDLAARIAHAL